MKKRRDESVEKQEAKSIPKEDQNKVTRICIMKSDEDQD